MQALAGGLPQIVQIWLFLEDETEKIVMIIAILMIVIIMTIMIIIIKIISKSHHFCIVLHCKYCTVRA